MDKITLLHHARSSLAWERYLVIAESPTAGVDFVVWCPDYKGPIFVAAMDGDKVRSIPLRGLGRSKKALARAAALKAGADKWRKENGWKGDYRYDALWIGEDCLSHIINIRI